MEQIDGSETSAFKNQTPGIHPKDYSQYSKHGESLKSTLYSLRYWHRRETNPEKHEMLAETEKCTVHLF
jgi:hypothetical protein